MLSYLKEMLQTPKMLISMSFCSILGVGGKIKGLPCLKGDQVSEGQLIFDKSPYVFIIHCFSVSISKNLKELFLSYNVLLSIHV